MKRSLTSLHILAACITAIAAFGVSITGCGSLQSELKGLRVAPTFTARDSVLCVGFNLVDSTDAVRIALEPQCFGYEEAIEKLQRLFPWLAGTASDTLRTRESR